MKGDQVLALLTLVASGIRAERLAQDAQARRAADLRDLRIEATLTEMDALVRERPGA